MIIDRIHRIGYLTGSWRFIGLLRNEKKFNLNEMAFIKYGGDIVQCKIVGIELLPRENPEYKYTLEIPKDLIKLGIRDDAEKLRRVKLICDEIFLTIDEAKESAIKSVEGRYKLEKEEIDRFFNQYNEKT